MSATPQQAAQLGYENGRLPLGALVPVQGSALLWPTVASAFEAMRAAAAADGVTLRITSSADAYRSLEQQQQAWGTNSTGRFARPGTSEHGWGEAVDLVMNPGVFDWLKRNAARFGFANTVSHENWHWGYTGGGSIAQIPGIGLPNPVSAAGDLLGDVGDDLANAMRKVAIIGTVLLAGAALVVIGTNEATGRRATRTAKTAATVAATKGARS